MDLNSFYPVSASSKSLRFPDLSKIKMPPHLSSYCGLIFLGVWISMCYKANLFLDQALICSAIIGSIIFLRIMVKNSRPDQHKRQ